MGEEGEGSKGQEREMRMQGNVTKGGGGPNKRASEADPTPSQAATQPTTNSQQPPSACPRGWLCGGGVRVVMVVVTVEVEGATDKSPAPPGA
jgi:hypothetical protein